MNRETRRTLNGINRRFYRERASEFSQTRERPWRGWEELQKRCFDRLPGAMRVLDVGCGNGRFARFLGERAALYVGLDQSPLALAEARRRVGEGERHRFVEHDFVTAEHPLPPTLADERFDLIVLFGVLHHVPGRGHRRELLAALAERLAPDGLLVFTVWKFDKVERFRKKLVPWPEFLDAAELDLDTGELEPGDHIMTWGGDPPTHRYCHAMSEEELASLIESLPLDRVAVFDGDDHLNRYVALRHGPC
jgi:tRNA (uracil-5-)-methyltransferase TRM9